MITVSIGHAQAHIDRAVAEAMGITDRQEITQAQLDDARWREYLARKAKR